METYANPVGMHVPVFQNSISSVDFLNISPTSMPLDTSVSGIPTPVSSSPITSSESTQPTPNILPPTQPLQSSQPPLQPPSTETTFKLMMDGIKKRLKKPQSFQAAAKELLESIRTSMTAEHKRPYYDALNIISFRVGKPGYSPTVALELFKAAFEKKQMLSAGYRKNIEEWIKTTQTMISSPTTVTARNDGRFNNGQDQSAQETTKPPRARAAPKPSSIFRRRSFSPFSGGFFDFYGPMSFGLGGGFDSDEDGWGYNSDSSDMSSDSESHHSHSHSHSSKSTQNPFSQFSTSDPPIFGPVRLRHTAEPVTFPYDFMISHQTFEKISSNPLVRITLCSYGSGDLSKSAELPASAQFYINDKLLTIGDLDRTAHGYDITSFCKSGVNNLKIRPLSCCCSYEFGIRIAEVHSVESLIQNMKEKHTMSFEDGIKRVLTSFKGEEDGIQEVSIRLSLRCPLSQAIIKNAARGSKCSHLQCFELESFLLINRNNPNFKCPCCSKQVPLSEIVIDSYINRIISEVHREEDDPDEVDIVPDATWKLPEARPAPVHNKRKNTSSSDSPIKRPKTEEESLLPFPIPIPNIHGSINNVEVVDLT